VQSTPQRFGMFRVYYFIQVCCLLRIIAYYLWLRISLRAILCNQGMCVCTRHAEGAERKCSGAEGEDGGR
jgi:hypothetical protein